MGALTNKQALSGELEPYSVSQPTMIKALLDAGFSSEDVDGDYKPEDKSKIAIAAIFVLKKLIVLTSDSLGKSSQGYSLRMIWMLMSTWMCPQLRMDQTFGKL